MHINYTTRVSLFGEHCPSSCKDFSSAIGAPLYHYEGCLLFNEKFSSIN